MKRSAYLERIGIKAVKHPDRAFLSLLQENHLLHVPFENLDIPLNRPIRISLPAFYKKIVEQRRGGFCYELNGLFDWLLRECGFVTSRISARVRNPDGSYGREFDHLTLLVHLDQPYLVDVGFGNSCRLPLPLTGEEVEDISGRYRIIPDQIRDHFLLQRQGNGDWSTQFRFTTQSYELDAFTEMCEYHQTSPSSNFTQRAMCTIATRDGRITLTSNFLTITRNGQQQKFPISSRQQFDEELLRYFGIRV